MTKFNLGIVLLVFSGVLFLAGVSPLSVSFFNQTPPGETAEVFAPGIVNTGKWTRDVAISPDGKEFYFGMGGETYRTAKIYVSREVDGAWSEPVVASFSSDPDWTFSEPAISPDGKQFFFASNRAAEGEEPPGIGRLWVMNRSGEDWGEPMLLPPVINNGSAQYFPSLTTEGTLYFTRRFPSGQEKIVRSRLINGEYGPVEILPDEVNGGRTHYNAFVAPDESYIIVPTEGRSDSMGGTDYFISFRNADDSWAGPINMGAGVNTRAGDEWSPYVSPDEKYFFFMRSRSNAVSVLRNMVGEGQENSISDNTNNRLALIWWMDAEFIESLRP